MVGVAIPLPQEKDESTQGNTIPTGASWGEQRDAVTPLTDLDGHDASLMVEHNDDNDVEANNSDSGDESVSLGSEEEEHDVEPFIIPPAGEPVDVGGMSSRSPNPSASTDMHEACHHMAEALTETTMSRYKGKRIPKAKSST